MDAIEWPENGQIHKDIGLIMVAETFNQVLRAFQRRTPFAPFIVELISGDRITIEHPEALVFRSGAAVYFSKQGEITIFDHEGVAQVTDQSAQAASA